jgi:ABC-type amino acid transport substrate-binding protein
MRRLPAVVVVTLLALGASRAESEVLRVGMDTRSRPWAYVPGLDYSREDYSKAPRITPAQLKLLEGLDIDFVKALEARLPASLVIVPTAWESIEQGLVDERFDLLINAWVPSTRTSKQIVASAPYYWWVLFLATRADDTAIR